MNGKQRNMTMQEFDDRWDKVVQILNGPNFNKSLLNSLKSDDLVTNQQHRNTGSHSKER